MPVLHKRTARAVVISDLHLGGHDRAMMSRPKLLVDFIDSLHERCPPSKDSILELVIAGDFVDFLAIEPYASWTPDPSAARAKLTKVTEIGPFAQVFDALGRHIERGHRLTVLLGNHDVELGLPSVQDALIQRLNAVRHEILFIDDGRAHRIGGMLIEHGNRYDNANINDYGSLRAIASAQTRNEADPCRLEVSAGSEIVANVVAPLKRAYPFIDLLQPTGTLVVLLLLALEPGLRSNVRMFARLLRGAYLERRNPDGLQPGDTEEVAYVKSTHADDPELRAAFADIYGALFALDEEVAFLEWRKIVFSPRKDGVRALLTEGPREIPAERLRQIRMVLRKLLMADLSDLESGPTGPYGRAARRLVASGAADLVVMGHTHLPRDISFDGGGRYINSGTWVDRFRVPEKVLEDDDEPANNALTEFLRALCEDRRDPLSPTFVDVRVDAGGGIRSAELCRIEP